jgi:transcriptional regulator with XRE-family HTH domain
MSSNRNTLGNLGKQLRERRLATGLSQLGAAQAAGVGRSTLIHLEHGRKDIRLSSILSIAEAIGASFGLAGVAPELSERVRLRAEETLGLARRRQAHLEIAVDLALGRASAARALRDARRMVALWRRDRTCSERYVKEWSRILEGGPAQVGAKIRDIDEQWLDALLQNTPFSGSLEAR